MPKKQAVILHSPTGGLNKGVGFQSMEPYFTPECMNVRPRGTLEQRRRIGSRPGFGIAMRTELGGGEPVRSMATMEFTSDDGLTHWEDDFNGTSPADIWADDLVDVGVTVAVEGGYTVGANTRTSGGARDDLTDLDTTSIYELGLFIVPVQGEHRGKYRLYAQLDGGIDPIDPTDNGNGGGVVLEFTPHATTGNHTLTLKDYNSSGTLVATHTPSAFNDGFAASGWLILRITSTTVAEVWWKDQKVLTTKTITNTGNTRFGFHVEGTSAGGSAKADAFRIAYYTSGSVEQTPRFPLAAISNGLLYYERFPGEMVAATMGNFSLPSDRPIQMVAHLQKLYLAVWGDVVVSGTDGTDTDADELDAASVADWTDHGINKYDHVVVISDATGDIIEGVYEIHTIASGTLKLTTAFSVTPFSGTCTYSIQRAPMLYNPKTDGLELWLADNGGNMPIGCKLVTLYRDRLILAGDGTGTAYASRSGDSLDFNYSTDKGEAARAWALGVPGNVLAGTLPHPVTYIAAYGDDCIAISSRDQLFILRGDPSYGGELDEVTDSVGVLSGEAGCRVPTREFLFVSLDGVYELPGQCRDLAFPVSRFPLPDDLMNLNPDRAVISMESDPFDHGVHIFVTYGSGAPVTHYWAERREDPDGPHMSFWPLLIDNTHEPFSIHQHMAMHALDNAVVFGCRDGKIRRFHREFIEDDGGSNAIDWHVDFGPINLGSGFAKGAISSIVGILDDDSASVTWRIFVGNSLQAVSDPTGSGFINGVWTAGVSNNTDCRAGGGAAIVRIEDNQAWPAAIESITITRAQLGRART